MPLNSTRILDDKKWEPWLSRRDRTSFSSLEALSLENNPPLKWRLLLSFPRERSMSPLQLSDRVSPAGVKFMLQDVCFKSHKGL